MGFQVPNGGDTKLDRLLAKNQHAQRKWFYFANWQSIESSKVGHHFRKLSVLDIEIVKKCQ